MKLFLIISLSLILLMSIVFVYRMSKANRLIKERDRTDFTTLVGRERIRYLNKRIDKLTGWHYLKRQK